MTQTLTAAAQAPATWCAAFQAKLMAALDAAWALAERSDDPAVIAKARDKAKLCGQLAAEARKIAAMLPTPKPTKPLGRLDAIEKAIGILDAAHPLTPPETETKPPAAQAVAMQAALAKLKRR